jgi:adenosine deaminase
MSATSLTNEIGILADTFGYDADDVLAFQLNAAEAAFLPLEDRQDLIDRIVAGFGAG